MILGGYKETGETDSAQSAWFKNIRRDGELRWFNSSVNEEKNAFII